jgi:hypothetical protein
VPRVSAAFFDVLRGRWWCATCCLTFQRGLGAWRIQSAIQIMLTSHMLFSLQVVCHMMRDFCNVGLKATHHHSVMPFMLMPHNLLYNM